MTHPSNGNDGDQARAATEEDFSFAPPTARAYLWLLAVGLLVLAGPVGVVRHSGFVGSLELHVAVEIVGAMIALIAALGLLLRYQAFQQRFHLFIGLAFFMNGVKDFVHGLICFRGLFGITEAFLTEFVVETYYTGQLLLGSTLLIALALPRLKRSAAAEARQEMLSAGIVLLLTMAAVLLVEHLPRAAQRSNLGWSPKLLDIIAGLLLATTLVGYLVDFIRRREMLTWWILAALGMNFVALVMMYASQQPLDGCFHLAHLYKVMGYLLPLVGLVVYQNAVTVKYQQSQQALIAAKEQALSATRAKSAFLANISHELRTPMNAILGLTRRTLRSELADDQRQRLQSVHDAGAHLLSLLNDLLDYSQIEAGKLELQAIDFCLTECVAEAMATLAISAQDKHLGLYTHCTADLPTFVQGDPRRVRQVLVNLVGNAVKFTEVGRVDVQVQPDRREGSTCWVRIAVADTGIGIPRDQLEAIFQPFVQADGSAARRYQGTGLGLAICHNLVERMGGTLTVTSRLGAGSRFEAVIPLQVVAAPVLAPARMSTAPIEQTARPLRVLLAEDNAINQKVAQSLLEEMGHAVAVVGSGLEAVDVVRAQTFDVVLMDLQMPGLDGWSATGVIRQWERETGRPICPIIALTAHAGDDHRQRCLEAGMTGFLSKPIDEPELFAILEAIADPGRPPLERATAMLERFGGDRTLLAELVTLFDQQVEAFWPRLDESLSHADADAVIFEAHRLAGSVSNFHDAKCHRLAKELEAAAAAGQLERCREKLPALRSAITELCDRLHQVLLTSSPT